MVKLEHTGNGACLQLMPNCSASWRQTQVAIAIVAATTLSVAIIWSLMGFWLILPFAGIEVALFGYLAYRVCAATHHQQVVLLSKDDIQVQWGLKAPKQHWHFKRSDAYLRIMRPRHSLSPHRLFLTDGGQSVAIADKLCPEDVDEAIACFRSARLPLEFYGTTDVVAAEPFAQEGFSRAGNKGY